MRIASSIGRLSEKWDRWACLAWKCLNGVWWCRLGCHQYGYRHVEELGWGCGSTALAIAAHNGLGLGPIVKFGSEAQKQTWLPPLASGQGKLACLSLTEPDAGSDLKGGIRTAAVREGDSWIIDGSKMWMTNASISDVMVVLCRTDHNGGSRSLSHILVPSDAPGITIAPGEKKMGLKGSPTHAVTFDEVRVPLEKYIGRGRQWTAANACYS